MAPAALISSQKADWKPECDHQGGEDAKRDVQGVLSSRVLDAGLSK